MARRRKSLKKLRTHAFQRQNGLCYYCKKPTWNDSHEAFRKQYKVSVKSAKLFRCTGEHLVPHSEGGSSKPDNIVAACYFCNFHRHKRKKKFDPIQYAHFVNSRVLRGAWNSGLLLAQNIHASTEITGRLRPPPS